MTTPQPFLLCALTMPPPVHGMAWINQQVFAHLKGPNTRLCNLSAGSLHRGLPYHTRRILRVNKALMTMAFIGVRHTRRPRTFYTMMDGRLGAYYSLMLCALAHRLGYRVFVHHHNATHTKTTTKAMRWLCALAPRATHIALSAGMAADMRARYPNIGEVLVSDNTCHLTPPAAPARAPHKGALRLGMLSNLTIEKGTAIALQTAIAAHTAGLDITLSLAGPLVDKDSLEATLAHAQAVLGDKLQVVGPLYGAEKYAFFQNLDVFLFPTLYREETQGLVNLEAMSQGCLVIAYGRGYIPEVLGNSGVCVPIDTDFASTAVAALKGCAQKMLAQATAQSLAQFKEHDTAARAQLTELVKAILKS